jgi:ribose transport system substrate-binding protein
MTQATDSPTPSVPPPQSSSLSSPSSSSSSPSISNKPRPRTHFGWLLILALLAVGALWWAGALRPKPHIAMVAGTTPYFDLVVTGAQEAARQYDVDLDVIRVKGDAQADAVRGLIGKKYAGVAVSPFNPPAEAALLGDLAGQTTLVTFDSDSPLSNRLCFVGTDNYVAGRLLGQQVRQAIPDGGDVVISSATLDKENGQRRRQGVIDELLDRPMQPDREMDPVDSAAPLKGQHYNVVATLIDAAGEDAIIDLAIKTLAANSNVKCLIGLNNFGAPRMVKALQKAGKLDSVKVVGFDADKDTLAGIEEGHVYASILQDQYGCGFQAVRILAENARGGNAGGLPLFQRRTLPVEIINKDNVTAIRGQLVGGQAGAPSPAPTAAAPTTQAAAAQ